MLVNIQCLTSAFVSKLKMFSGDHFESTTKSVVFNVRILKSILLEYVALYVARDLSLTIKLSVPSNKFCCLAVLLLDIKSPGACT